MREHKQTGTTAKPGGSAHGTQYTLRNASQVTGSNQNDITMLLMLGSMKCRTLFMETPVPTTKVSSHMKGMRSRQGHHALKASDAIVTL